MTRPAPQTAPQTAYEILGVSPFDDFDTIRAAWRALVRAAHPDVAGGDRLSATRRLAEINGAFDALRFHEGGAGRRRAAAAEAAQRAAREAEAAERAERRAEEARLARQARRAAEARERQEQAAREEARRRSETRRQAEAWRRADGPRRAEVPHGLHRSASEKYRAACRALAAAGVRGRLSILAGAIG